MTEYTRESPFEFEGVKVWHGIHGVGWAASAPASSNIPSAIHAFIDAEREGWHWINADHTEARNGRWTQRDDSGIWVLHHDDFIPGLPNIAPYWTDATTVLDDQRIAAVVRPVIDSFYAWLTEQGQPGEPTGFGAVVEVADKRYLRDEASDFTPWWRDGESGVDWEHILDQGPVTVLSEGVTR